MRRRARVLTAALCSAVALAGLVTWNSAFRVPSTKLLPVPAELIPSTSARGQQLLAEGRFVADYDDLVSTFESQSRPAFCGVASSVIVLNALLHPQPRLTQSSFFNDAASRVRGPLIVTFSGMTLAQLTGLLRTYGVEVRPFYASDANVVMFRTLLQQNLSTPGDVLLINYQRAALGQGDSGHISPVAAYNAASDRVLILDVAAYKYPPVWVAVAALWKAMNTVDPASGRTRGFLVVQGPTTAVD